MSDRVRMALFGVAAATVLATWLTLTLIGGPQSSRRAPARTVHAAAPPPTGRATIVGASAGAAAPVPPAARSVARAYARDYVRRRRGARLLDVTATDDPATPTLELTATLRLADGRRRALVMGLQAEAGHWWVAGAR